MSLACAISKGWSKTSPASTWIGCGSSLFCTASLVCRWAAPRTASSVCRPGSSGNFRPPCLKPTHSKPPNRSCRASTAGSFGRNQRPRSTALWAGDGTTKTWEDGSTEPELRALAKKPRRVLEHELLDGLGCVAALLHFQRSLGHRQRVADS